MTNTHALGSFTPPATRLIIMFFYVDEAVSKVTDTVSFFTYTKQSSDFPKPELCNVPDFLYLWT